MGKSTMKKHMNRYLLVLVGCIIGSLGFNLFLIPGHLLSGGLGGIAIIIYYLTSLPIGMQLLVFNVPLIYIAYKMFGRLYALDTIIGTFLFSLCIDSTSFLVQYEFVKDTMLNAIFGGVLAGIGFGMVFKANANTGGLDVIGAVVKKFYSIDIGTGIFALNMIIIIASILLFNLEIALFTLVSIYVTAELTNRVAAGFNREKSIMIISPRSREISRKIMETVNHGSTFINGVGGFTNEEKQILFVVVSLTQVNKVKLIVELMDPEAFMIVSDTSEVSGKGFTIECDNYQQALEKWYQTQKEREEMDNATMLDEQEKDNTVTI